MYNLEWLKKNNLLVKKIKKPFKKKSVHEDIKRFSYLNWNKMKLKKNDYFY